MDGHGDPIVVLFVDDDSDTRALVDAFFEQRTEGISVVTAASGAAALDRLDGGIDCIVADYDMPEMNGLELLRSVRAKNAELPFILHTAMGSERVASEAISAGVTDYFRKTSDSDGLTILARRIENVVAHRRAELSYRDLFEKATEGFALNDPATGAFIDANASLLESLGHSHEDLLEMGLGDVVTVQSQAKRDRTLLAHMERAADGDVVTLETRVRRPDGTERWLAFEFKPIEVNGRAVVLTQLRDVTERKRHEETRSSLHASIANLVGVEQSQQVIDCVLATVDDISDVDWSAVFFYDPTENRMELVGERATDRSAVDSSGSATDWPASRLADTATSLSADSPVSRAFIEGTSIELDTPGPAGETGRSLLVPLGDHGVLAVGHVGVDDPFGADDREFVEILSNGASAALDRIQRDSEINSHRETMRSHSDEIQRSRRATAVLRELCGEFVRADVRTELYETVCGSLGALEPAGLAWIGVPGEDGALDPVVWTGDVPQYLDTISLDEEASEPATVAARTGRPVRIGAVGRNLRKERWRRTALSHGIESVMAIPIEADGTVCAVLSVLATEPGAFRDGCDDVLLSIASAVGDAVESIDRRQGATAATPTEITYEIDPSEQFFGRLAAETGGVIDVAGVVTESANRYRVFVETSGVEPARLCAVANELAAVHSATVVVDDTTEGVVEFHLATPPLGIQLAEYASEVSDLRATGTAVSVTVTVARPDDVRAVAQAVLERYPSATLRSKQRQPDVEREFDRLLAFRESLTPRQREVLQVAYLNGYFDSPRRCTGDQLGVKLGISSQAVYQHLRAAQQKLLDQTFERSLRVSSVET